MLRASMFVAVTTITTLGLVGCAADSEDAAQSQDQLRVITKEFLKNRTYTYRSTCVVPNTSTRTECRTTVAFGNDNKASLLSTLDGVKSGTFEIQGRVIVLKLDTTRIFSTSDDGLSLFDADNHELRQDGAGRDADGDPVATECVKVGWNNVYGDEYAPARLGGTPILRQGLPQGTCEASLLHQKSGLICAETGILNQIIHVADGTPVGEREFVGWDVCYAAVDAATYTVCSFSSEHRVERFYSSTGSRVGGDTYYVGDLVRDSADAVRRCNAAK